MAVYACVTIPCSFLFCSQQRDPDQTDSYFREREIIRGPAISKIYFSNFDAVLHIQFRIDLTVKDKLNECIHYGRTRINDRYHSIATMGQITFKLVYTTPHNNNNHGIITRIVLFACADWLANR